MKIIDIIRNTKPTFSFEFFPPKTQEGMVSLFKTISKLEKINPSFVSITYGAMGTTRKRTLELVEKIRKELSCEIMAHLTCIGSTKDEISFILDKLKNLGVSNILALRGDYPEGFSPDKREDFPYAANLVKFIKDRDDFCIGVAGYPDCHKECLSLEEDIRYLRKKVSLGADFIITQLFFHNKHYFSFIQKASKEGISLPILPGIMPITNYKQIKKFQMMCGCKIESPLKEQLEKYRNNPSELREFGIDYATRQCEALLSSGAPGIHFYTLNRSEATHRIWENLTG
ncbi:MAG: methylenetetrahydrofolate reductase [NAD(P)H] [Candidatus Auribacterota bacterium]|nr:methylenetetrahydrofolate reductase [NAD(P)H] [Candidatus Auribacterota bacterium]